MRDDQQVQKWDHWKTHYRHRTPRYFLDRTMVWVASTENTTKVPITTVSARQLPLYLGQTSKAS